MTSVLQELEQEGYQVIPEAVAFLSPYWIHQIRRFGDYSALS